MTVPPNNPYRSPEPSWGLSLVCECGSTVWGEHGVGKPPRPGDLTPKVRRTIFPRFLTHVRRRHIWRWLFRRLPEYEFCWDETKER